MNILNCNKEAINKLIDFKNSNKFDNIKLIENNSDIERTVYIEQNGDVLGIATIYHNAFHPNFENLQFAVDTKNELLINMLYNGLLKNNTDKYPRLSLHLSEIDAKNLESFLKKNNFYMVLKTEFPKINIEKSIVNLLNYNLPDEYRLKKYSELNEIENKLLYNFRLSGYIKTHFWSPPLNIESPYWRETDMSLENKKISWVIFKNENIILCSDAHIEGEYVYLGWSWYNDDYENIPELENLWSVVLNKQLNFCKMYKKILIGEFDSSDKYGQLKSSLLIHLTEENYYTYQKT